MTGMADQRGRLCFNFLCLGMGLLSFFFVQDVECFCSAEESKALVALKRDNPSKAWSSWIQDSDCCRGWAGVTCDARGTHVIALNLTGRLRVKGNNIPGSLCELHKLQVLNISITDSAKDDEKFSGRQIPDCIWNMTEMRYLALVAPSRSADLKVPMSAQICTLHHLVHLDIATVLLLDKVPDCLGNITELKYLDLGPAPVSNSFLSEVCKLKNLTHLRVGGADGIFNAQLIDIPACLWKLAKLEHLSLLFAYQSSLVPVDLCNLLDLKYLELNSFYLTGDISGCLWKLKNLEHLDLSPKPYDFSGHAVRLSSGLEVHFFSGMCNLRSLSYLSINLASPNHAHGYIPECFWSIIGLEYLYISSLFLPGSFSPQMCNLSKLRAIDISHNSFTGTLPACFWNLTFLEEVEFTGLDLSKMEVPSELSVTSLEELHLGSTRINKRFLNAIGNFSALQDLDISANNIPALPDGIQNLCNLLTLNASYNSIATIPPSSLHSSQGADFPSVLFNLTQLQTLSLSNNFLRDFPSSFCNTCQLVTLDLSWNNISGNFSALASICNSPQLTDFDISNNNIYGNISAFPLRNKTRLVSLLLSNNLISGFLSFLATFLPRLVVLDLSGNQLTGEIPNVMLPDFLPKLSYLDLSNNQLTGQLPKLLLTVFTSWLSSFDVSGNQLSGVPFTRSALNESDGFPLTLQYLDMSYNNFSGMIPSAFGVMKHLEVLDLTSNRFHGIIPKELNFEQLSYLALSHNNLSGLIPNSIGALGSSLQSLAVSNNALEGPIPSSLGKCWNLQLLDLSHNRLNGSLPATLKNLLSMLRVFTVASNQLHGHFPTWIVNGNFSSLQFLDISNNHFYGNVPADYSTFLGFISGTNAGNNDTLYEDGVQMSTSGGNLDVSYFVTARVYLDVSSNHLSGLIPAELGELLALKYLNFSANNFFGSIPPDLSKLHELEILDLSRNSLTGGIPPELNEIPQLSYFNVSNNFLTGPIPEGGQFNTFNNEDSFRNNTALCRYSESLLPLPLCRSSAPQPSAEAPQPILHHHHSWRQDWYHWFSLDAFFVGFGSSFGVVALTFLASKSARGLLYVPRRKLKIRFDYSEPYGLYLPRT